MRTERGQALIEFALVLPFLLLFALGIVFAAEVGVARVALLNAASEGARVGSLTNDDERITSTVRAAVTPLAPARVALHIEPGGHEPPRSRDPRGSILRVSLSYGVPVPLGFAGLPSVTVGGSAARVIEWTP